MHAPAESIRRYAIYFSPSESSRLAKLGNEWLGRDAGTDIRSTPTLPHEINHTEWSAVTETARRYGFHATLKPPFQLAEDATPDDLQQALRSFGAHKAKITAPHLVVGTLGHFLALILSQESTDFSDLAADCVREFDPFRAPANEEEIRRRLHDSLTQREREHLLRWGYPYVLDTWKFHMTLTCSLPSGPLEIFREHLSRRFAEVCMEPLCIDSICLYEEPGAGMPFRLLERFKLGL